MGSRRAAQQINKNFLFYLVISALPKQRRLAKMHCFHGSVRFYVSAIIKHVAHAFCVKWRVFFCLQLVTGSTIINP